MNGRFSTANGTLARINLLSATFTIHKNGFSRAYSCVNAIVPEGVRLDKDAVVAAGAVVAGAPARVINARDEKTDSRTGLKDVTLALGLRSFTNAISPCSIVEEKARRPKPQRTSAFIISGFRRIQPWQVVLTYAPRPSNRPRKGRAALSPRTRQSQPIRPPGSEKPFGVPHSAI